MRHSRFQAIALLRAYTREECVCILPICTGASRMISNQCLCKRRRSKPRTAASQSIARTPTFSTSRIHDIVYVFCAYSCEYRGMRGLITTCTPSYVALSAGLHGLHSEYHSGCVASFFKHLGLGCPRKKHGWGLALLFFLVS